MEEERTHISIPEGYVVDKDKENFWRLRLHFMLCDSYSDKWKWSNGIFCDSNLDVWLGFGEGIPSWTFNNTETKWNWLAFQALYSTAMFSRNSDNVYSDWLEWDNKYRKIFEKHARSIDENLRISWGHVSEHSSFDRQKKEKCLIAEETFNAVDKVGFVNFIMDENISVTCVSAYYRRVAFPVFNRNTFKVENLPSGEMPTYVKSIVIGDE